MVSRLHQELERKLGEIENDFLKPSEEVQGNKKFVQGFLERMLATELKGITSDIFYSGSNYELTEVPGPSDYDIQYFIKTDRSGEPKPTVQDCGINGWKKIKGGPKEWQTADGYLSPYKVRQEILGRIDKAINAHRGPGGTHTIELSSKPSDEDNHALPNMDHLQQQTRVQHPCPKPQPTTFPSHIPPPAYSTQSAHTHGGSGFGNRNGGFYPSHTTENVYSSHVTRDTGWSQMGGEMSRSTGGPAITLHVKRDGTYKFAIDIVACVKARDTSNSSYDLVAKPYDKRKTGPDELYWRVSYSQKEKELLHSFDRQQDPCDSTSFCRRKLTLFRVIKLIKYNQPQLRHFPSYFYKNLLFKLHRDYEHWTHWDSSKKLVERFIDIIETMYEALCNLHLACHFNPDINLLDGESSQSIEPAKGLLKKITKEQRAYMELLRSVK